MTKRCFPWHILCNWMVLWYPGDDSPGCIACSRLLARCMCDRLFACYSYFLLFLLLGFVSLFLIFLLKFRWVVCYLFFFCCHFLCTCCSCISNTPCSLGRMNRCGNRWRRRRWRRLGLRFSLFVCLPRWRHSTALYTPLNGIDCCFSFLISGIAIDQSGLCYYFFSLFGCNQWIKLQLECICYTSMYYFVCAVVKQAEAVLVFQPSPASFLLSRSLLLFFSLFTTLFPNSHPVQFGHISGFLSRFHFSYLSSGKIRRHGSPRCGLLYRTWLNKALFFRSY